jgi:hypothetical protein
VAARVTGPRPAIAGFIALTLLAGCGVRGESSETRIEPDDVPFELLEPTPSVGQSAPDGPGGPGGQATIFLDGGAGLVPVVRELDEPARPADVLRALVAGPTPEEEAFGVQTAITSGKAALSVRTDGTLAVVELGDAFFSQGADQVTALAQIVFTLTGLEPITRIRFLVGAEPAEVPRADGVLTAEPVGRADFAPLVPAATGT